jgi:hypothetical protein
MNNLPPSGTKELRSLSIDSKFEEFIIERDTQEIDSSASEQ